MTQEHQSQTTTAELGGASTSAVPPVAIPPAAVARLTLYLRELNTLLASGVENISSGALAQASAVSPTSVRKDLSYIGTYGTRGVGYQVAYLAERIESALGLGVGWRVAICGAGNLGKALAGYQGFKPRGFEVVAILDADDLVIGTEIGWLRVSDAADIEGVLRRTRANMLVLALPAHAAQSMADRAVDVGVRSILNFAPVMLQTPPHVHVRKVDMATELQILAYHSQQDDGVDTPAPVPEIGGATVAGRRSA